MAENTAQCRHRWPAPLLTRQCGFDAAKLQDTAALVLREREFPSLLESKETALPGHDRDEMPRRHINEFSNCIGLPLGFSGDCEQLGFIELPKDWRIPQQRNFSSAATLHVPRSGVRCRMSWHKYRFLPSR
jgi:hypothetical protein